MLAENAWLPRQLRTQHIGLVHHLGGPRSVLAISEFTRAQAIKAFDLDADKVTVVPPVLQPLPAVADARRKTIVRDLGLRDGFVLYPAAMYPHKNHAVLLRAFAGVVKHHDVDLALTGAVGAGEWGSAHSTQAEIAELTVRLGIERRVHLLGYLTTEQRARAISDLLSNPSARTQAAAAGRARAIELAAVNPVQRLIDVYWRAARS